MALSSIQVMHNNALSCIKELIPIISEASKICVNDIINGESIRGSDLNHKCGSDLIPYAPSDDFIVFQMLPTNLLDVTTPEDDETISNCISLKFLMTFYGNHSIDSFNNFKTCIQSMKFKDMLWSKGMTFVSFDEAQPRREFINDTLYLGIDTGFTFTIAIKNPIQNDPISTGDISFIAGDKLLII